MGDAEFAQVAVKDHARLSRSYRDGKSAKVFKNVGMITLLICSYRYVVSIIRKEGFNSCGLPYATATLSEEERLSTGPSNRACSVDGMGGSDSFLPNFLGVRVNAGTRISFSLSITDTTGLGAVGGVW